jgi:hypothetical protein
MVARIRPCWRADETAARTGTRELSLDDAGLFGFKLHDVTEARFEIMRAFDDTDNKRRVLLDANIDSAEEWGDELGEITLAICRDYFGGRPIPLAALRDAFLRVVDRAQRQIDDRAGARRRLARSLPGAVGKRDELNEGEHTQ